MAAIHQGIHSRFTESRIFQEGLEIPVQRVVLFYHDHDIQILFHVFLCFASPTFTSLFEFV